MIVRQLQISELFNRDIVEDIIFNEEITVSFEYDFGYLGMKMLEIELLTGEEYTDKLFEVSDSPLRIIKRTLNGKIIDAIENNTFKFIDGTISFDFDNTLVVIDCRLQLQSKF
jgi:uncharacterized protein YjiK